MEKYQIILGSDIIELQNNVNEALESGNYRVHGTVVPNPLSGTAQNAPFDLCQVIVRKGKQ